MKNSVPAYCHHRPTGQAYATVRENGKPRCVYLGVYGSPASHRKYAELVAALAGEQLAPAHGPAARPSLTFGDAAAKWAVQCETYYRLPDGSPSREIVNHRYSWAVPLKLLRHTPIATLTRRDWVAARDAMIAKGWCRKVVNQSWNRIVFGLKWLAEVGEIDSEVVTAASLITLPKGRAAAPERPKVPPVELAVVRAAQTEMHPLLRDMIELQLLTAMRPGEVRGLTLGDEVRVRGLPSLLRLRKWKMMRTGKVREIPLSTAAAAIVARYAEGVTDPDAYLFCPRSAPKALNRKRGGCYGRSAYNTAIARACERAGVPRFGPHRIRHLTLGLVRRLGTRDDARALAGHDDLSTTDIYLTESDDAPAARKAAEALERLLNPPPPPEGEGKEAA